MSIPELDNLVNRVLCLIDSKILDCFAKSARNDADSFAYNIKEFRHCEA